MSLDLLNDYVQGNTMLAFSMLLLIGTIGGRLAHYSRFLPRITGYIIAGFVLGPHLLGFLQPGMLASAKVFSGIAISIVLFQLGSNVNLNWIREKKNLLWMALFEGLGAFILVFLTLMFFDVPIFSALLIAAIGMSSSPAITLLIAEEYHASGPIIQKSYFLTAFNNTLAFFVFSILFFFFQFTQDNHYTSAWSYLYTFYNFFGSILLAMLLSFLLIGLARFLGKHENSQFAALIGTLILANGLADILSLSPLLTSLMFGVISSHLDKKDAIQEVEFGYGSEIFFIILFVFAGASLHAKMLMDIGWVALAFIAARIIGKSIPIFFIGRKMGMKPVQSAALSVTMLPLAGTAIGLLAGISHIASATTEMISAVVLAAIAVLETVGPIFTLLALKITGELGQESFEELAENHPGDIFTNDDISPEGVSA